MRDKRRRRRNLDDKSLRHRDRLRNESGIRRGRFGRFRAADEQQKAAQPAIRPIRWNLSFFMIRTSFDCRSRRGSDTKPRNAAKRRSFHRDRRQGPRQRNCPSWVVRKSRPSAIASPSQAGAPGPDLREPRGRRPSRRRPIGRPRARRTIDHRPEPGLECDSGAAFPASPVDRARRGRRTDRPSTSRLGRSGSCDRACPPCPPPGPPASR